MPLRINPKLRPRLFRQIDKGSTAAAGETLRALRPSLSRRTGGSSAPGATPSLRSGGLRDSWQLRPPSAGRVSVSSSSPYARIQEYGGTIRAKNKKLTVPLNDRARAIRARYRSLRQANLKASGGYLEDGNGNRLFKLVDSVTLPARPYVRPMLRNHRTHRQGLRAAAREMRR